MRDYYIKNISGSLPRIELHQAVHFLKFPFMNGLQNSGRKIPITEKNELSKICTESNKHSYVINVTVSYFFTFKGGKIVQASTYTIHGQTRDPLLKWKAHYS
jgi:hypothetical protein